MHLDREVGGAVGFGVGVESEEGVSEEMDVSLERRRHGGEDATRVDPRPGGENEGVELVEYGGRGSPQPQKSGVEEVPLKNRKVGVASQKKERQSPHAYHVAERERVDPELRPFPSASEGYFRKQLLDSGSDWDGGVKGDPSFGANRPPKGAEARGGGEGEGLGIHHVEAALPP